MRRGWIFLAFLLCLGFASASINVHNYSIKTVYFPFEKISGWVNLTLSQEDFTSKVTSNNGGSITLKKFLEDNGGGHSCDPFDCSSNYNPGNGSTDKTFSIFNNISGYSGFVLDGDDVEVTSIRFNMSSNFPMSTLRPITIEFFEDVEWEFNSFSNTFGGISFGCYEDMASTSGPLIGTSTYCETIPLLETGSVFAGARTDNADTVDLSMVLYSSDGGSSLGNCEYNPLTEEGCVIEAEEGASFPQGDYYVCVEADNPTLYHIYEDRTGETCGFVYANGPENSTKDYGIYAATAKYANSTKFKSSDFDFDELTLSADELLETRYNRDCTSKCVLPIKVTGVAQNYRIHNVAIYYTKDGEDYMETKVYPLEMTPAVVDFLGVLDLGLTGFNASKSGKYIISIGEKELFDKSIEILPAPIIKTIYPHNPPAGVPVLFYVTTEITGKTNKTNQSLIYDWDFGDGSKEQTKDPYVVHAYKELSNYSLKIEVTANGNLTSEKSFTISTVSPKEVINSSITGKQDSLNDFISEVNTFPVWYQERLKKLTNLSYYQTELERIVRARDNANYDEDYLEIATSLYNMDVPSTIYISEHMEAPLMNEQTDIDPSIIFNFAGGGSEEDFEAYKGAILKWQTENIDARIGSDLIVMEYFSGAITPVMRIYSASFTSHSDDPESYLVINKPFGDIYFKSDSGARKIDSSSIIVLDGAEKKSFEFYYFDHTLFLRCHYFTCLTNLKSPS